jgi:hypothetical protein
MTAKTETQADHTPKKAARADASRGYVVEAAALETPSHFLTNTGRCIPNVVRVEYDGPAASGMATVTVLAAAADGLPVTYRDEADQLQTPEVTFRASVRVVPVGLTGRP